MLLILSQHKHTHCFLHWNLDCVKSTAWHIWHARWVTKLLKVNLQTDHNTPQHPHMLHRSKVCESTGWRGRGCRSPLWSLSKSMVCHVRLASTHMAFWLKPWITFAGSEFSNIHICETVPSLYGLLVCCCACTRPTWFPWPLAKRGFKKIPDCKLLLAVNFADLRRWSRRSPGFQERV